MAFINKNGESVSFECSELIGEYLRTMSMTALLILLEKENELI